MRQLLSRRALSGRVLALAALVALLAGARALVWATARPRDRDVGALLLDFDPAQVQAIELQRGADRVRLERAGAGWVVASHGGLPARERAPELLLERLRGWRIERLAGDDPARHAAWMVDAAQARQVRLLAGDGRRLAEVWVGRVTGIAADLVREQGFRIDLDKLGLFVRRLGAPPLGLGPLGSGADASDGGADPRTFVVNDFLTRELDPRPEVWFVRPLVRGSRERASRLVVRRPGAPPLDLRLTPPPHIEGEARPIDFPRAFGALTALFLLEALGPAGGAPPPDAIELELEVQGEAPQRLRLWSRGARWFLATEQLAVEVRAGDAAQAAALTRREALLARELLRLVPDQISRLHWQRGAEERSLVRHLDRPWDGIATGWWHPLAAREVEAAQGTALLTSLCALRLADWIVDPAELARALGPEPDVLALSGSVGREELRFGPVQDGRRACTTSRLPGAGGWVDAAAVDALWSRLRALTGD
ncbi:MAG: hypothetical protein AB7N76_33775 [Planctomycetota bacterium]